MANLEYDIPNTPTSVFRIGSTSKQFTAASIILLVERGKLKLDDKLTKFFPEFQEYANQITIAHLLNHTSGIREYITLAYLAGYDEDNSFEDEDVMNWLIKQNSTNIAPGEKFLYSNSGYWLLGKIVEKVSGKSLAEFAQHEIFQPLAMKNTHFHNNLKHIVKNRASGYEPISENSYQISMSNLNMIGDGGVFSTIKDLKKWDDAYYQSTIFSDFFWLQMLKPGQLNNGENTNYASGLLLGEHEGLATISHGGAHVGYRAELLRFPEEKLSLIVLANRADGNATAKAYQVANLFIQKPSQQIDTSTEIAKSTTKEISPITLTKQELSQFVGDYWDENRLDTQRIFVKENQLMINVEGGEYQLEAIAKNKFYVADIPVYITLTFNLNSQKEQTITTNIPGEYPRKATIYQMQSYDKQGLTAFSGNYFSQELNANYRLTLIGDELILHINDKRVSAMQVVKKNLMLNAEFGAFTFQWGQKDKIIGFNLATQGVSNLEFTKSP